MPPAELQMEDEINGNYHSSSGKKARPGSGKGNRKGSKRQKSEEPDAASLDAAQPASAVQDLMAQAAKKKSPYFAAAAAPSQANDKLKSFKKVKLAKTGSRARESPADSVSAELATPDLGIHNGGDGELHKHATSMVSPRSGTAAAGPEECYKCEKPLNKPAATKASSPASASVQLVASSPFPQRAEQGEAPAENQDKTPQKQPGTAVSESSDRVGDWNPEGEARAVSSEAEAASPDPSSIVVEANNSPPPSQAAEQEDQVKHKARESSQEIIPDTQQENSADAKQGSVSIVHDTPENESWATGEGMSSGESQGYQPANQKWEQEGISAGRLLPAGKHI